MNRIVNLSGLENPKFWEIQNGVENGQNRQNGPKTRDCARDRNQNRKFIGLPEQPFLA